MDPLKNIRRMEDLPLEGRRVLIRVDFNVPVTADGDVVDDSRIQAAIPTIRHAIEQGAKVVLASHLGRPNGRRVPELSMLPVGERLRDLLSKELGREVEVFLPEESVGDGPRKVVMERVEGDVVLLENLRFYPEEEANDNVFAMKLAALADVFVNDAFSALHRQHASISAAPKHFAERGVGLLLMKELSVFGRLVGSPDAPFVALLGGSRVPEKIGVMNSLLPRARTILVGGQTATTFLAARGLKVGKSRVEPDRFDAVAGLLSRAKLRGVDVMLPTDVVVATEIADEAPTEVVPADAIPAEALVVDIGPETAAAYAAVLKGAKTVLWDGPMGYAERKPFLAASETVGKAIARSSAMSVVTGIDTVAAVNRLVLKPFFKHVSTGGSASIALLEGRELPGLDALREET